MVKNKKNHSKRKIKTISLLTIILIIFFTINGIRLTLNNQIFDNTSTTNLTQILGTNPLDKLKEETTQEIENIELKSNENCTWVKTRTKVPITEYIEDIDYIDEIRTKNVSYTYSTNEAIRTLKKEIKDTEYNAQTYFKTKDFTEFYKDLEITSWIASTNIAFYNAPNKKTTSIKITNTDSKEASYKIYRVYQPIKNSQYFDSYNTTKEVTIKKGQSKEVEFEQSILCLHLDDKKENWIDYYKDLIKEYKSEGLKEEDFITFEYKNEPFACFRPYFIVIPNTYEKEYKVTVKKDNSHYSTTIEDVDKYECK